MTCSLFYSSFIMGACSLCKGSAAGTEWKSPNLWSWYGSQITIKSVVGHSLRNLLKSQVAGSWVRMDFSEHSINSAAAAACSSELGGASLDAMHLDKR